MLNLDPATLSLLPAAAVLALQDLDHAASNVAEQVLQHMRSACHRTGAVIDWGSPDHEATVTLPIGALGLDSTWDEDEHEELCRFAGVAEADDAAALERWIEQIKRYAGVLSRLGVKRCTV